MNRRVHVTGASGFVGGHTVPLLLQRGHSVTALARSGQAADRIRQLGAEPVAGDLDDPPSVVDAFRKSGADVLLNIASLGFGHAPVIVAAAESAGVRTAVFVSTTAIFTALKAPSKSIRTEAEHHIEKSTLDWTIIRPTMIYGTPADRNLWRLLRFLRRAPAVPLPGGGQTLQQPIHVDDLAGVLVSAVELDVARHTAYDVAGPEALTFRRLITEAAEAVGRHPVLVPLPARPLVKLLDFAEARGRRLPLKAEQVGRLTEDKAFDISAAVRDLGFAPRPFAAGICAEARMTGP